MAKQEYVQKQTTKTTEEVEVVEPQVKTAEEQEAFDQEIGDLLDEIEGVLEANAQEWIANFVQRVANKSAL